MNAAIRATWFCACLLPLSALAASPFDGTWKADMSTAKLPSKPFRFELSKGVFHCFSCEPPVTVKADGADHAVAGDPYADTMVVTVVDGHTVKRTGKKAGRVVLERTITVSPDGKTMMTEYIDRSATTGAPTTGKATLTRVSAGPKGSAALSGEWRETAETESDNGVMVTYKVDGDTLSMSTPTGQSFAAKLYGTEAPYKGDPGTTTVAVKRLGPGTIEETDRRNSKIVGIVRTTFASDGKTATASYTDTLRGMTMSMKMNKVAG